MTNFEMDGRCRRAGFLEGDVAELLARRGMRLRVSVMRTGPRGRTGIFHWMINDDSGRRVVDYWPCGGTWWCRGTGERGHCADVLQIVEVASKLASCARPVAMMERHS